MKKKIAILSAIALCLCMAAPVFAAPPVNAPYGGGCGYGGYGLMWDQEGNFLAKDAFEAKLDKAIEDGLIRAEDKAYLLDRYEWCAAYGGGSAGNGYRGGCCGRGAGMYR